MVRHLFNKSLVCQMFIVDVMECQSNSPNLILRIDSVLFNFHNLHVFPLEEDLIGQMDQLTYFDDSLPPLCMC